MGENKRNIFITGSPDIDIILKKKLPSLEEVKKRYQIKYEDYAVAILHSVVTNTKYLKKVKSFCVAIDGLWNAEIFISLSEFLISRLQLFLTSLKVMFEFK